MSQTIYQFKFNNLQGKEIDFTDYKGKVLLIVNTATKCGRTPQLLELEELYQKYKNEGFIVFGFPSNDFNQEPMDGEILLEYCSTKYGITFPMFEKSNVKGKNKNPVFHFFSSKKLNGKLSSTPRWNFYKYLIGRDGKLIDYYWSYRSPKNKKIIKAIEKALAGSA